MITVISLFLCNFLRKISKTSLVNVDKTQQMVYNGIIKERYNTRKEVEIMTAKYNGRTYEFRGCDTNNMTQEELQQKVNESGRMQYDRNCAWLVVRGVGYGWEVNE